ncbi:MAG: class I SAM-dependent DNA methyltransferase [Thermoplasmata archaeon]
MGPRVTAPGLSQFHELAKYYDPLNEQKDYRRESERLEKIARRFGPSGRTAWLDVACGTGRHLEVLARSNSVQGVDGSREMLRIARRRLPGVRLTLGDMRTFWLDRQFEVVSCLFSAIGHLASREDVRKTFANFARHLTPGGVAIVEPWIDPAKWRSGFIHLQTFESPDLMVARCSSSQRKGNRSTIHFHFLIGEPGHEIRYREVTDVGLLLSRKELLQLMRSAGLKPRFLSRGLTAGRGLLVGVKV